MCFVSTENDVLILHRSRSVDGDCVPCQFKNLELKPNASRMIWKNINDKLRSSRVSQRELFELSEIEQLSSFERKIAYFIRFHLRDILTTDHRHVWFYIQTKSIDEIEDHSQIFKTTPDEINVVYSFGSLLSHDTFMGHFNHRSLARIQVMKFPKAIMLDTTTHRLTVPIKYIHPQVLINHKTNDNSIQIIFMLKAAPIVEEKRDVYCENKRLVTEVPKCSDLLVRFFPASTAWVFLRDLPIAGYSRRSTDSVLHINFALFDWRVASNDHSLMGRPSCSSPLDSYAMEMLWSLDYLFQDKYNEDSQFLHAVRQKNTYNLCCVIWKRLKEDHCYRLRDALVNQTLRESLVDSEDSSQSVNVAYAIVTPSRIEYQPLQTNVRHRALQIYPAKNWLLVHMRDDNGLDKIHELNLQTRVRFRNLMIKGIQRDNGYYRYFGSSNSQMKEQAGWFLLLPPNENMDQAREKIGKVSKIRSVSTYIARVGLYLTTSRSAGIKLTYKGEATKSNGEPHLKRKSSLFSSIKRLFRKPKKSEPEYMAIQIPDEKRNEYTFTDGCGKISLGLARKVAQNIGIQIKDDMDIPSAFQVRIAGYKGMLSIDPESRSNEFYILVRESMKKFDSDDWTLHIVDHSRPMPLSLNNQVIRLLSDLGVQNGVFESIQTRCIDRKEFWHPPPRCYLNAMDSLDQALINERRLKYRNAKHFLRKNKIPLPINEARNLFGIADETQTLKPGECFIQYRHLPSSSSSKKYSIYEGPVIVTKHPCLHPGDIRLLRAGYELQLENIVPSLLYPPAEKKSDKQVTNERVVDYVLDTFTDSFVGIIANVHKAIADKHPRGTLSKECAECAELFARAIDARKTGESISMVRIDELKKQYYQSCPRWMMKFDKPEMDPP
ncbi:unnamed protein product, partial [Adineta ricciae]